MDGPDLRRARLPRGRVAAAVGWAIERGCDTVLVEWDEAPAFTPEIVHHVCADPGCPGGC